MNETNMITVGKVRDAHGLKGELFLTLFAREADWFSEVKELTLVRKEAGEEGKMVPVSHSFRVKRHKFHKAGLLVLVDGISDRTAAEGYQGALFQIPKSTLISKPGEKIYLSEIQGFTVTQKGAGEVGTIESFSSNGAQDLAVVRTAGGDFEVPLVEQLIVNLDFKNRIVEMDIPEGLIGAPDQSEKPDDADPVEESYLN